MRAPGAESGAGLGWLGIVRLGLVQAAVGALSVLATSTLSRIMIVELALPAVVPGALVAAHHLVQASRPRFGHGTDRAGRRTPTLLAGMAVAAVCAAAAAGATTLLRTEPWIGGPLALAAFIGFGLGVGAAGTALLTLLAERTAPARRPAAATLTWLLMTVGFVVCAASAGRALEPYTPGRLLAVSAAVSAAALLVTVLAVWGVEPRGSASGPAAAPFRTAWREVAREPAAVRFAVVIFVAMLAYSGQELLLEPLAGALFGWSPGASTALMGVQRGGVLLGMVGAALVAAAVRRARGGGGSGDMGVVTAAGCGVAAAGLLAVAAGALAGPGFPIRPAVFALGLGDGVFAVGAVGAMMTRAGRGAPGREGVRMGLWGAAQALAFAAGGVLATGVLDGVRAAAGRPAPAYAAALGLEAVLFVAAAALVLRREPADASAPASTLAAAA